MDSPTKSLDRQYSPFHDISSHSKLEPLTDKEIDEFFRDIDKDGDGVVTFDELEAKLAEVHQEIAPEADTYNLHHPERRFMNRRSALIDPEKAIKERDPERDGLYAFLVAMMPGADSSMSKQDFIAQVKSWNVPSQMQTTEEMEVERDNAYEGRLLWWRKARAYWSVFGPKIIFCSFVFITVIAFFLWQGIHYYYDAPVRAAFGWGIVLAKFSAGALYPLIFFLLLSMSRWFQTFMRQFYWISRFVNWDRTQSFHIKVAYVVIFFTTLHCVGHLTGSFIHLSDPEYRPAVEHLFGTDDAHTPRTYAGFLALLPGWTGLAAMGLFYVITFLSLPPVRKRCYELFQLGHLLMFPFLGLLCAHGASKVLQYPMMGFWIAGPLLLIIIERGVRVIRGFIRLNAHIEILDDETVNVNIKHPKGKNWRYHAGQFVFLQVPELSLWQWHPFTVSVCIGDELQLHIKTDGNWTGKLLDLARSRHGEIKVGLDGPFGAPAQRFYDFDRSLIIGSGVGITPFSAILNDLELHLGQYNDPWSESRKNSRVGSRNGSLNSSPLGSRNGSRVGSLGLSRSSSRTAIGSRNGSVKGSLPDFGLVRPQTFKKHSTSDVQTPSRRRVDFHWMVRERNSLLWFSSLLNRVHDVASELPRDTLELNIQTHITAKKKNISTHVFRYLLDAYRTTSAPVSALTGLKARSNFGRPDLEAILQDYYNDEVARMKIEGTWGQGKKVGVFFCGSPQVGRVLADACAELTTRGRTDGSKVRFVFMLEVFS